MLRLIVDNYNLVDDIPLGEYIFNGTSAAVKQIVFHIFPDCLKQRTALDIGFGRGELGKLIKSSPLTSHWEVDGIDGFDIACRNKPLFDQGYYRNIWHGYAQDLPQDMLQSYDLLCLLDVIEHLNANNAKNLLKSLLTSLREDALLFISTPLWFYPQDQHQKGDLEEHLIGVPAASMVSLRPLMYLIGPSLVGNFVLGRQSLQFIDAFEPTTDRTFNIELGQRAAIDAGLKLDPGALYKTSY